MRTKTQRKSRQQQKGGLRDRIQNRALFGTVVFIAICVVGLVCIVIKAFQVGSAIASSSFVEGLNSSAASGKAIELMFSTDRSKLTQQQKLDLSRQIAMLHNMASVESNLPWGASYLFQIDGEELARNPQLTQYRAEITERFAPLRGYIQEFVDDTTEDKFYETCGRLKLEIHFIEQVISETEARSSDIGEENANIITTNLHDLIESINQAEEFSFDEEY